MRGEFHIHTTYSDGTLNVWDILKYVDGVDDYISITDHDILEGSIEACNLCKEYQVKCIIGVEISSFHKNETVHILGYFKTSDNLEKLKSFLLQIRNNRINRLYLMKEKLKDYFDIDLDIKDLLKRPTITRGSIAREIVKQGFNYTIEELFKSVIGTDCPAYIPSSKIQTQQAIDLVHQANGKAVLAHPTLLKIIDVEEIVQMGIDGIEAIYPLNKENEEIKFREIAKKNGLFISAGSDFHTFNDSHHGDLLTTHLEGNDLEIFLKEVLG